MEIDLKDGFFSIPVEDRLARFFGFSYGVKRYRWVDCHRDGSGVPFCSMNGLLKSWTDSLALIF